MPDYGYVGIISILHERMGSDLYNDWVGGNLGELTHADRQGKKRPLMVIHMQKEKVCVQIPHEVYARIRSERRYVG